MALGRVQQRYVLLLGKLTIASLCVQNATSAESPYCAATLQPLPLIHHFSAYRTPSEPIIGWSDSAELAGRDEPVWPPAASTGTIDIAFGAVWAVWVGDGDQDGNGDWDGTGTTRSAAAGEFAAILEQSEPRRSCSCSRQETVRKLSSSAGTCLSPTFCGTDRRARPSRQGRLQYPQ